VRLGDRCEQGVPPAVLNESVCPNAMWPGIGRPVSLPSPKAAGQRDVDLPPEEPHPSAFHQLTGKTSVTHPQPSQARPRNSQPDNNAEELVLGAIARADQRALPRCPNPTGRCRQVSPNTPGMGIPSLLRGSGFHRGVVVVNCRQVWVSSEPAKVASTKMLVCSQRTISTMMRAV
jgi:hypothetical protein